MSQPSGPLLERGGVAECRSRSQLLARDGWWVPRCGGVPSAGLGRTSPHPGAVNTIWGCCPPYPVRSRCRLPPASAPPGKTASGGAVAPQPRSGPPGTAMAVWSKRPHPLRSHPPSHPGCHQCQRTWHRPPVPTPGSPPAADTSHVPSLTPGPAPRLDPVPGTPRFAAAGWGIRLPAPLPGQLSAIPHPGGGRPLAPPPCAESLC